MTQPLNSEYIRELEAFFIGRNDVINRFGNIAGHSVLSSGLVGYWPMSSVQLSTGDVYDISGQTRTMSYNGNPTFNHVTASGVPYIDLDGTGDYLERNNEADLRITGIESQYANPGLTLGCWVYADTLAATSSFITKWLTTGNQRSYALEAGSTATWRILVSNDGTFAGGASSDSKTHSGTFATGGWHCIIGRWNSTNIGIAVDGELEENATSIASIFSGTANFDIGARSGGTDLLNGRIALPFLCAYSWSNASMQSFYQQTKVGFGV